MRKRTGLRNRRRDGRSPYSVKGKGQQRDSYGSYNSGRQLASEIIAGHTQTWRLGRVDD